VNFLESKCVCDFCPIQSQDIYYKRKQKNYITYSDSGKDVDVLVITDTIYSLPDISRLKIYLKNLGVSNFAIVSAIGCPVNIYQLPSPDYSLYSICDNIDIDSFCPKVVLTLGKAIFHFTQSSILDSWSVFNELNFNETWFLPGEKSKYKGRIYPTASLTEILNMDSFENYHFRRQIQFINEYIKNYEPVIIPPIQNIIVEDIISFINENEGRKYVAIDTETNSLNCYSDNFKIGCVTLSFDGITGYYINFSLIEEHKERFSNFIKSKFTIFANGKFDSKAFTRMGINDIQINEDITILFHIMNTERPSNSIKVLSWLVGFGGYETELEKYIKKNKIKSYLDIPSRILNSYAVKDVIVTFRLWQYAKKYLIPKQADTYKLYRESIIPVIPVLQEMEKNGIVIDSDYLNEYHTLLVRNKKEIEKKIYEVSQRNFNINSNDELGKVLKELKFKNYGVTKKGIYKTGEEQLLRWKQDGHLLADLILRYREISKLDNTFVGDDEEDFIFFKDKNITDTEGGIGINKYIMSDGKIHGSIMPAMTRSWRAKSFEPNLQNFPKHGDEGKAFRKIFKAPDNFIFCEADYSGFQLRIASLLSNDSVMKNIFINLSGDIHSITAVNIFHRDMSLQEFLKVKGKEPYKASRFKAKTINFGFLFGRSAFAFKNDIELDWSAQEIQEYYDKYCKTENIPDEKVDILLSVAEDIRTKFFETYPALDIWIQNTKHVAQDYGYIESEFFPGGRRHLPELQVISNNLSKEKNKYYNGLFNIAVNSPVQLFEAIIVYRALVKIYRGIKDNNLKSMLIATVHDSIVLYIHVDEIEKMYYLIKESMEVFEYEVPIICEQEYGTIWGFGEEINESNLKEFVKIYENYRV
jgi:DNA polymerase I-like protein with 3'-5' exonuclease and polymerase domains